jgi:hypothetical protein
MNWLLQLIMMKQIKSLIGHHDIQHNPSQTQLSERYQKGH